MDARKEEATATNAIVIQGETVPFAEGVMPMTKNVAEKLVVVPALEAGLALEDVRLRPVVVVAAAAVRVHVHAPVLEIAGTGVIVKHRFHVRSVGP